MANTANLGVRMHRIRNGSLLRLWLTRAAVAALLILTFLKVEHFRHHSAALNSVTMTPSVNTLPVGLAQQFWLIGSYSDGKTRDLTAGADWTSSNENVVAIDNTGLARAVGVGESTIQVISGGTRKSLHVRVTSPEYVGLALSPGNLSTGPGTIVRFSVVGSRSDGKAEDFTKQATWSSSDPTVAAITSPGIAKAGRPGQSVIRATFRDVTTSTSLMVTSSGTGFSGVFASRYDNSRTAQNRYERILTPLNVNAHKFGKKFANSVDGYMNAQPLYVPDVLVRGKGTHNLVYAATQNNSVYAFDADSPGDPIWTVNLGPPAPAWALPCKDVGPTVGITGTPLIDPETGTMYVVARTINGRTNYYHLHALDIATGAEKFGGPIQISATVSGTAEGNQKGRISFDPQLQLQRPGLALANGQIYIGFGSTCDFGFFHGWLFAYDAKTLSQNGVFMTTPNGSNGGIWQSGAAPAVDVDGNLYVVTGDGEFDANVNGPDYGDSILKIPPTSLHPSDYFAPFDQNKLADSNKDLGVGGAFLVPDQVGLHPHLAITAGKDGTIYVIDRDNMGHTKSSSDSQIVQTITQAFHNRVHVPAAFWTGETGSWVYMGAVNESLKAFSMKNGLLSASPTSESLKAFKYPGPSPAVSSNGGTNGVVWTTSIGPHGEAIISAYDATNLANLLYDSTQAPNNRDKADPYVRFTVPTVANGHVYFGTQNHLEVYGLLP